MFAKIYGLFSLKVVNEYKVHFIVMQNLNNISNQLTKFVYDLKFSEVNRQHIKNIRDLVYISDYLINKDP